MKLTPLQGRLNGNGREFEDFLVLQVGVGSAVSASLARQIENAVDWPDRVEGAGVAALERHLARPVVVDTTAATRACVTLLCCDPTGWPTPSNTFRTGSCPPSGASSGAIWTEIEPRRLAHRAY